MAKNWDRYSRQGIDLAHSAASFGFFAAKAGTRLGFSIARGLAAATVGATTTVIDIALFGGSTVTRPVFGYAVSTVLTLAEQITLAPIHLSEYITSTSLIAAHSSINALAVIFPGSSDASFSLASFIDLVRREWSYQDPHGTVPEKIYGITHVARAMVGWVSLQGVTQEWQEQHWFKYILEGDRCQKPSEISQALSTQVRVYDQRISMPSSRIRVTSDVIFPGQQGPQIIAADIGEPEPRSRAQSVYLSRTKSHISLHRHQSSHSGASGNCVHQIPSNEELKATMRRLSKMVLAGYGGASLLFFGVSSNIFGGGKNVIGGGSTPLTPPTSQSAAMAREKDLEETQLANAVDAAEAEAAGDGDIPEGIMDSGTGKQEYSWWDVLLGKHDQEIFEQSTSHPDKHSDSATEKDAKSKKGKMKATAVIGQEHLMPRFWVLTDHGRGQIVLVIRGTMSLNEIAVDLTCEPDTFQPASTPSPSEADENPVPGRFAFPAVSEKENTSDRVYHVHGGMLRMAKAMGDVGKPVHLAVLEALYNNPDYDLVLCGHSLGAGVAALLAMIWADPRTCLTVKSSGLPIGRNVQVYAFAPPCLTDAALSRLSSKLIVSLVYSHDVVSRLSLGSVRDMKNAAMWLCEAEAKHSVDGWSSVIARTKRWKDGNGSQDDMNWFIAMRKTLEANMHNATMYPPGRVLWAMRDGDLHPSHQLHSIPEGESAPSKKEHKLRLFEVMDVEKIFYQIVFARNMLTAHLPHQYDQVIHDLI